MKRVAPLLATFVLGVVFIWRGHVIAQAPPELLIRRASIVNADGRSEGDIRIRGEKIAEIGRNLTAGAGAREIDAGGFVVLPGGIDPHVHPGQNFTAESAAALAGGTTTISTMVSAGNVGFGGGRAGGAPPPPNPFADEDLVGTIQRTDEKIKKEAMADFILHVTIIFGAILIGVTGASASAIVVLVLLKIALDLGLHLAEHRNAPTVAPTVSAS